MARNLMLSAASLTKAGLVCGLAALSTGSMHFAWGSVAHSLPAASLAQRPSETSTALVALQADAETTFVPDALIVRPLFSPGRRQAAQIEPIMEPPAEVASVASPPEELRPSYIVGGLIVSAEVRKILLRREQREAVKWLSQGDMTGDGWTVVSIKTDGAILKRGGREFVVPFRANTSAR
jgi:hypothetical protein